jgi:hypothetical protein
MSKFFYIILAISLISINLPGLPPKDSALAYTDMPVLTFADSTVQNLFGTAYVDALTNLIDLNVTGVDFDYLNYNTGLMTAPPGTYVKAGEIYDTPWTRDSSISCWTSLSLLDPAVAKNSLWSVCKRQSNNKLIIDQQWWDKIIWVTAAWNHYKITGDNGFLYNAYECTQESLNELVSARYNTTYGLFKGPAVLADGISGYPAPPANNPDSANPTDFVLNYPFTDVMMVLSTNCVYYNAYRCAAAMATQLGRPQTEIDAYTNMANSLRNSINQYFWIPGKGLYGYFIHGGGFLSGTLDQSEEGMGLSYAILFGVADPAKVNLILQNAHVQLFGITCVYPHFARFNDAHPGRHNQITWPVAQGMWADAAAISGNEPRFEEEVSDLGLLEYSSEQFFEIYNCLTGEEDGGWQCYPEAWQTMTNQTWSATAYLQMIYHGLFGMRYDLDGIRFQPLLPSGWGTVNLNGIKYRGMILNIILQGSGNQISTFTLDGIPSTNYFVSNVLTGVHTVMITLTGGIPPPVLPLKIEAENTLKRKKAANYSDSGASGGKGAEVINTTGSSLTFLPKIASSRMTIHYSALTGGTTSLYVNRAHNSNISFSQTGAGIYGDKIVDLTLPAYSIVKIQTDSGDVGVKFDFIQFSSATPAPTPAPYKYDFGTSTSPVETGYNGVSRYTLYNSGSYGWTDTYRMEDWDRGTPADNLKRDICYSTQIRTFRTDIPNGTYTVDYMMGDDDYAHDSMYIKANGTMMASGINTSLGQFITGRFSVSVIGGNLQLEFGDTGGIDPCWIINSIVIRPGIVLNGTATASSSYPGYSPGGANDGVVNGYPNDITKEWASNVEKAGAWIKLDWGTGKTINKVKLYDRINYNDRVMSGTLSFSDGSTVSVGALPNDGYTPLEVSFTARTVTWAKFTAGSVSPDTYAIGLAEFEVYQQ